MPFSPYMMTPDMVAGDPAASAAMGSQILMGPGGTQSYDRFKGAYQARTGDVTADPFIGLSDQSAATAYNQAAANQNSYARSQQYGLPLNIVQNGTPMGIPSVAQGGSISPAAAAVAGRARGVAPSQSGMSDNEVAYYMRNPEEQNQKLLMNPAVQELTKSLGVEQAGPDQAAAVLARTGMMPERRSYHSSVNDDQESPNYGLDEHVLNNPKFRQLQSLHPELAAKTYEALTGVSLDTAAKTVAARRADREKLDDMMVSRLVNDVAVDPSTGQLAKRIRVRKTPGFMDKYNMTGSAPEYEDQYVPLNSMEHQWLKSGALQRKTGLDLPSMLAQRSAPTSPSADPHQSQAYAEALKRTGDPEYADLMARKAVAPSQQPMVDKLHSIAQWAPTPLGPAGGLEAIAKRGLSPQFKGMMKSIAGIPGDLYQDPEIVADTASGIGSDAWNLVKGLGNFVGSGSSSYPR